MLVVTARVISRVSFLKIGGFVGVLAFYIMSRRRKLTIENISKSLSVDLESSKKIAKEAFKHFGLVAFEAVRNSSGVLTENELNSIFVDSDESIKKLKNIYYNSNKRVIFITAHLGGFELIAQYIGCKGVPMSIIGRPVNNPYLADFLKNARELFDNTYIEKGSALIGITKAIKNGRAVGLLPDQKSGAHNSEKLMFLGRLATTALGTARLAKKLNCAIVPVFAIMEDNFEIRLVVQDEVEFGENDYDFVIMQKINDIIGNMVIEYPNQWFWMHNRWKM